MSREKFALLGAEKILADPAASPEWRALAAHVTSGELCPVCGNGTIRVETGETERTILRQAPRTMPRLETVLVAVTVRACNSCEFVEEVIK